MPFTKVQPEKLSSAVVSQIELLILRGVLRPGERLPSERDLADRLGVSRPSLREAISELQAMGLLASKAGSGVYVADVLSSAFSPALAGLFGKHTEAMLDYITFRRDVEALAAERAARFGSESDLKVIQTALDRMAGNGDTNPATDAQLDAQFHSSIIEASHNVVMLHVMRAMFGLLSDGIFYNRQVMFGQSTTREALLAQHVAINEAIQARDPAAARKAMEAHLNFVEQALMDQFKTEHHETIARQRLAHEAEMR